jgi:hypothetical protein
VVVGFRRRDGCNITAVECDRAPWCSTSSPGVVVDRLAGTGRVHLERPPGRFDYCARTDAMWPGHGIGARHPRPSALAYRDDGRGVARVHDPDRLYACDASSLHRAERDRSRNDSASPWRQDRIRSKPVAERLRPTDPALAHCFDLIEAAAGRPWETSDFACVGLADSHPAGTSDGPLHELFRNRMLIERLTLREVGPGDTGPARRIADRRYRGDISGETWTSPPRY